MKIEIRSKTKLIIAQFISKLKHKLTRLEYYLLFEYNFYSMKSKIELTKNSDKNIILSKSTLEICTIFYQYFMELWCKCIHTLFY